MDAGHLIAIQVTLLYSLLSPLVLLAIYVFLDFLSRPNHHQESLPTSPQSPPPALWTEDEIDAHMQRF